jgi:thiol-disulfide isomerase/thioredoxin
MFSDRTEYASWVSNMSPEQALQLAIYSSETYTGVYGPNELICFRDYREVAPGVWIPFREDRAFTHRVGASRDRHKYIRLTLAVQEVRTDLELADTIRTLSPAPGERIQQDTRFGLPLTYDYSLDRTPRDCLKMVDAERRKPEGRGWLGHLTWPIEQELGAAAPALPANGWLGGRPPKTGGKPYLLHFWAAWADGCKEDFPALKQLSADGAIVLGIHPAETPADIVARIIKDEEFSYPTLLAPAHEPDQTDQRIAGFPVWQFPYCVLVDAQGKIAAHGSLDPGLLAKFAELRGKAGPAQPK